MSRQIYFVINNLNAATTEDLKSAAEKGEALSNKSGKLLKRAAAVKYDSLTIDFPIDFIQTNKPRYIQIKNAKYYSYENTSEPPQVSVCSDIIQNEKYSDSFLCFCNEAHQYKVLRMYDARTSFYLWLKDAAGKIMDLDPAKGRIFIELLLEF
jgi:hypothetical protein